MCSTIPIIIICTKSSKKNFYDDIKKIKDLNISNFDIDLENLESKNIKVMTYKKILGLIINKNVSLKDFTVIVDEAHH
jgi:hypothetical protein